MADQVARAGRTGDRQPVAAARAQDERGGAREDRSQPGTTAARTATPARPLEPARGGLGVHRVRQQHELRRAGSPGGDRPQRQLRRRCRGRRAAGAGRTCRQEAGQQLGQPVRRVRVARAVLGRAVQRQVGQHDAIAVRELVDDRLPLAVGEACPSAAAPAAVPSRPRDRRSALRPGGGTAGASLRATAPGNLARRGPRHDRPAGPPSRGRADPVRTLPSSSTTSGSTGMAHMAFVRSPHAHARVLAACAARCSAAADSPARGRRRASSRRPGEVAHAPHPPLADGRGPLRRPARRGRRRRDARAGRGRRRARRGRL